MSKDYYEILGVDKNASKAEIEKQYKKLVLKYHPDVNKSPDAEKQMAEINAAKDILLDDQKRKQYDTFGNVEGGGFEDGFSGGFGGFSGGGFDFESVFGEMFGFRSSNTKQPQRGEDEQYRVIISLEDAVLGAKKKISYNSTISCVDCKGYGYKDFNNYCKDCRGEGYRKIQRGFTIIQTVCNTCQGSGKANTQKCDKCYGSGSKNISREVEYHIPRWINNRSTIKVPSMGKAGLRGGPAGDLIILIEIQENSKFTRDGNKLFTKINVPLKTILLGGQIEIFDIAKKSYQVKIPKCCKTDATIAINNEFYIILNTVMPHPNDIKLLNEIL